MKNCPCGGSIACRLWSAYRFFKRPSTEPLIIAFDCDGTLIDYRDEPRADVLQLVYKHLHRGDRVIVWSGGGHDYARITANSVGLAGHVQCFNKCAFNRVPDIAYDDQNVNLGKINIRV